MRLGLFGQQAEVLAGALGLSHPFLGGSAFQAHEPAGIIFGAGQVSADFADERSVGAVLLRVREQAFHVGLRLGKFTREQAGFGGGQADLVALIDVC